MISAINARRVTAMSDLEINDLIDFHLFAFPKQCSGDFVINAHGVYRCVFCGAVDDRAIAATIFDDWHPREPAKYSHEGIVGALRHRSRGTQIAFALSLRALIIGDEPRSARKSALTESFNVIMNMTARLAGMAALMALGIVDEQGYLKEGQE